MNIWNKVFLGVIFAAAIAVFVLGAVNFYISNTGQRKIADLEKKIAETGDKIAKLVNSSDPSKPSPDKQLSGLGIEELRGLLRGRYDERGRAWFGCMVAGMEERTLPPALQQVEAMIIITGPFAPSETGGEADVILPETLKGVVYVFEEKEGGEGTGAFLGRFNVSSEPIATKFQDIEGNEKNGWRIALLTIDPISEEEVEKIFATSKSRWSIYLTPPVVRIAGVFDQLTEEEKQIIPEEIRNQLQSRSKPELTEEEKEGVAPQVAALWEKYWQTMDDPEAEFAQDYPARLDWQYQQRSSLSRNIRITESDIETYKTAEEKNNAENKQLEEDCILEDKRVAAMNVQRDAVKGLAEQYEAERNKIALQIEKLQALIEGYVAEIKNAQLKAVEKIEEQIESGVRSQESEAGDRTI